MNPLLHHHDMLPAGITVHKDPLHPDGIRIHVMRKSDRLTHTFTVPIYKKLVNHRVSLFRWKEIEIPDQERINAELQEKGWQAVRALTK